MSDLETVVLPPDLVESQLSMAELLMAMYPPIAGMDDEVDPSLAPMIAEIREWCGNSALPADSKRLPTSLELTLSIPLEDGTDSELRLIQMNVSLPLRSSDHNPIEPPPITYTVRQPFWMSRTELSTMVAEMPVDDVVAAFEYVRESSLAHLQNALHYPDISEKSNKMHGPLLRVWFYFPSLSTREKRKDLVNYAPRYDLTGFVLAGKPGVLCLEGTSANVDDYMNAIKNESWGDIPSHQKKVSEKFREECGEAGRKFEGMREITDDLGERRGTRKNRGDMAALEAFLTEQGVGESFSKVIMGS